MNALTYLIQVNLYLVLFYSLYYLILRNETFFKMNRLYLVGSVALALAIPSLKSEWIKDLFVTEQIYQATQVVSNTVNEVMISEPVYINERYSPVQQKAITAGQAFWILYGSITLLFLLNFLRKLYFVNRALNDQSKHQAFSFFNKVVVDEELQGKETIIDHEMVHVKQWHSLDVIFFELFAAFNWFNPIAFLYKKAIKNIHEFIADETAASTLEDKSEYALLLVSNAFGTQPHKLTNSFYNNSLLKTRLIMLNKNKSRKTAILKYGLSVPLFAAMVILSSATIEKSAVAESITAKIEESIPQVIEAITDIKVVPDNSIVEKIETYIPNQISELGTENFTSLDDNALNAIGKFFMKSVRYPPSDQDAKLRGKTYVAFEIDQEGLIKNFTVIKAMSKGSELETKRVAKSAQSFGKGLEGKYVIPIKYTIATETKAEQLAEHDYTNDAVDLSKLDDHKILKEIEIIGYLSNAAMKEITRIDKLHDHFIKNIKYPSTDHSNNITGVNYITFELDILGKISNLNYITAISETMKAEINKAVENAPAFGEGSSGKYIQPVLFALSNSDMPKLQYSFPGIPSNEYKLLKPAIIRGYAKVPDVEIKNDITPGAKTKDGLQTSNSKMTGGNNRSEGMQQHLMDFFSRRRTSENGKVYIGFEVLDQKPRNYRIIKSEKPDWEKDLVKHFELYNDTVNVHPGKYYFYMKISEGSESNEEGIMGTINGFQPFFGYGQMIAISLSSSEENVRGVKSKVNYISAPYLKNPVILVDGKIVRYKNTKKGFRIEPKDYPKNADVKVYQGEKAVENYNESARKRGLIVVTTR